VTELFGIDLGMGAIKIKNGNKGIEFVSQVSVSNKQKISGMYGVNSISSCILIEMPSGQKYFVGKNAHSMGTIIENFSFDRFTGSIEMRVLIYGVFSKYIQQFGVIDSPIKLIVGLPIETLSGDVVKKTISDLKGWLNRDHFWKIDGKEFELSVQETLLTSQPAGAFFDFVLDMDGKIIYERQNSFKKEIGIVSVGMNTVELLVIRNKCVVDRFSSGSTSGVRRLLELVNSNQSYSIGELDILLRSNNLDISQALPIWEREVSGVVERCWGKSWKRFEVVLIVGGGAILLKNSLPYYFLGKAIIPDDPVMSIARGLYKLGLFKNKLKNG